MTVSRRLGFTAQPAALSCARLSKQRVKGGDLGGLLLLLLGLCAVADLKEFAEVCPVFISRHLCEWFLTLFGDGQIEVAAMPAGV